MSSKTKIDTQDWYGAVIGLQFAITELAEELCVDTIQENPRLFSLAIEGLKAKADRLVELMRNDMAVTTGNAPEGTFEITPVESPDDWVTQDRVPARPGIDQRAYAINVNVWEDSVYLNCDTLLLRCRRKDLPPVVKRVPVRLWFMKDNSDDGFGSNVIVSPVSPTVMCCETFQEIHFDNNGGFYVEVSE